MKDVTLRRDVSIGLLADLLEKVGPDEYDRQLAAAGDQGAKARVKRRATIAELKEALASSAADPAARLVGSRICTLQRSTVEHVLELLS